MENRNRILDTDIYCITAEKYSCGRNNIEVVEQMIAAGIEVIQYREKNKNMRMQYKECCQLRAMTAAAGVTFIINDHVDLAMLVEADGIHLGQKDLPLPVVRELVGNDMIIGLSTHSPQQAKNAVAQGADYIGVGPLFATETKEDVCEPVGLEYLNFAVNNIEIPQVAIGGIKENNVNLVKQNGAECICMVTEIVGAYNIKDKINSIRKILDN